jgi:hypothetical protein
MTVERKRVSAQRAADGGCNCHDGNKPILKKVAKGLLADIHVKGYWAAWSPLPKVGAGSARAQNKQTHVL